jgi:hypothetical protein
VEPRILIDFVVGSPLLARALTLGASHLDCTLATPPMQHTSAKGVPGLACEDRLVGANRGALS